jgi:hypothetical protein
MTHLRQFDHESVQTDIQFLLGRIKRSDRLHRWVDFIDAALASLAVVLAAFAAIFLLSTSADRAPRATALSIMLFVFALMCLAQLAYRIHVHFTTCTRAYALPLICINVIVMGATLLAWLHVQFNLSTLL